MTVAGTPQFSEEKGRRRSRPVAATTKENLYLVIATRADRVAIRSYKVDGNLQSLRPACGPNGARQRSRQYTRLVRAVVSTFWRGRIL
jgi:hypothetical protein